MKAFVSGLILGAVICFAVMRSIAPNQQLAVTSDPAAIPPPNVAAPLPEAAGVSQGSANASAPRNIEPNRAGKPASSQSAVTSTSACPTVAQRRLSPEDMSEAEASDFCMRLYSLQAKREQEKKDGEPRDTGWADSMEALMRQHIESNMSIRQYSKLQVECRTTFCLLRMEGVDEEARELANKLAQDIANQSWSESIVHRGSGGDSTGEIWRIRHEWFRPMTETERRLWPRRRN